MKIKYKKLSDKAFPPVKSRITDAGIDFRLSRPLEWVEHENGLKFAIARTDIAIEVPMGYYLATAPRSSMLFGKHISVFHSVIDTGYQGEITFLLWYLGSGMPLEIKVGDKIAQGVLIPIPIVHTELEEVDQLPVWSDRGEKGFGSTGK